MGAAASSPAWAECHPLAPVRSLGDFTGLTANQRCVFILRVYHLFPAERLACLLLQPLALSRYGDPPTEALFEDSSGLRVAHHKSAHSRLTGPLIVCTFPQLSSSAC
jgi:hypothetical protein